MKEMKMPKRYFKPQLDHGHKLAILKLAWWTDGLIEEPFELDGEIFFIPHVTCYNDGVLSCVYMVESAGMVSGKDLGLLQYYCFRKGLGLTVFGISTGYILNQYEKPEIIIPTEFFPIDLYNS